MDEPGFLDARRLAESRGSTRTTESLAPAIAALRSVAVASLDGKPPSVMDKAVVAPSNDRHDFVSLPVYFWPNPDTQDGFPWVRRDGFVNPAAVDSDVGRFFGLVDDVEILALRGWYCGDQRANGRLLDLVRTWFLDRSTRMNPSLDYAHLIPGTGRGTSFGVIDFQRAYHLLDLVALVAKQGATLTADEDAALKHWFRELRDWLLASGQGLSESSAPNNHGTWYDVQVVAYSRFIGDDMTARSWLADVTAKRLDTQISSDGAQPCELARVAPIEYATFNAFGFAVLCELGRRLGVDLWSAGRRGSAMARAIDWLAPYLRAERPIGRTTKHRGTFTMAAEAAQLLRIGGVRLERDDYEQTLADFPLLRPSARANLLAPPTTPPPSLSSVGRLRRSRSSSRDPYAKTFIVGCPKSGTVWIRDILDCHPYTVVGPESHLFGRVYKPIVQHGSMRERVRRTMDSYDGCDDVLGPERGPKYWIGRDDLERAVHTRRGSPKRRGRAIVDAAFDSFFFSHGGTNGRMLVEKTPHHIEWAETILDGWPEAHIVEIVRDGRDVVASMGHAAWAPSERGPQIERWIAAVERGNRVRATDAAAGRWHVIRYEHLRAQPRDEIQRLFDFLELPWESELLEDVVTATEFDRMRETRNDHRHRRRGQVGSWRDELDSEEVELIVAAHAGSLLQSLGYALD